MKPFYCEKIFLEVACSFFVKYTRGLRFFCFLTNSDVEGPFVANLSIYSQSKGSSFLRGNKRALEVCLGKESIEFDTVGPVEKRIHRIDLKGWPENSSTDNFQILVSIGLHVNHRTMAVVNQTRFYEDYLTVYVRGGMTPVSIALAYNLVAFEGG